jgi:hypothetical protein
MGCPTLALSARVGFETLKLRGCKFRGCPTLALSARVGFETLKLRGRKFRGCPTLALSARVGSPQVLSRVTLFQNLHHRRDSSPSWFADQEVNMLRHHDITHYDEPVSFPNLFENFEKEGSLAWRVQQGPALATTGSDEMEVARSIASRQAGHTTMLGPVQSYVV